MLLALPLPAVAATEVAASAWAGQYAPQGADARETGGAYGGRVRVRWSERWGLEAAAGSTPAGVDPRVEAVAFLGDPSADLVVLGAAGIGWEPGRLLAFGDAGLGMDVVLLPVLDLRLDARLRVRADLESALVFTAGPQLHTPRRYDRDRDGVADRVDACGAEPEDRDGWEDGDGCPDRDDDGDGLADHGDRCPRVAEDRDGFLDADGCPEPDNDGDGLDDDFDACIRFPEDPDGFQDGDGCPEEDNDGDGVLDEPDGCPNTAEDPDGFEDADGCPEPDNDGDGVGDRFDAEPLQPETLNGWKDADGAPDTLPPVLARFVDRPLPWRFRGATPDRRTAERLDLFAAVLASFPEVRVAVRVADGDAALAKARADAVVAALVAAGVDPARLVAEGVAEGAPGVTVGVLK